MEELKIDEPEYQVTLLAFVNCVVCNADFNSRVNLRNELNGKFSPNNFFSNSLLFHPVGRAHISDWSVNSFIMVVDEKSFFKLQSNFLSKAWLK